MEIVKICSKCKKTLSLDCFHKSKKHKDGHRSACKFCRLQETKDIKLLEKIIVEHKICTTCRKEKSSKDFSSDLSKKDGLYTKCKLCCIIKSKNYYINNPGYKSDKDSIYYRKNKRSILDQHNTYESKKRRSDPNFRLKKDVSRAIRIHLIKQNLLKNGNSVLKFLPYSIQELKEHLESLFEPWMNWENQGVYKRNNWDDNDSSTWKWNIDHIIPHSKFHYSSMKDDEFKNCWALNNLRPYPAKQNLLDGATRVRH